MFIVQFDKTYIDGALAGLLIPGETVTYTKRADAERALQFYAKVENTGDFIRAAVTGNRYKVSNIKLHHRHSQVAHASGRSRRPFLIES